MKGLLSKSPRGAALSRNGRWIFAGLVAVALVLLALGRTDHPAVVEMRSAAADAASPLLAFLSRPVERIEAGIHWLGSLSSLLEDNARLKGENATLRHWRATALALEQENDRLRSLLKAPVLPVEPIATPRVIGVAGGPFVRSVLINAGRSAGLAGDQPVIDDKGLVGRVVNVGMASSRVLLLTDLNSRVPVKLQRTGAQAIARGRNDPLLELRFLPPDVDVIAGDAVITTGDGGIFPPDIIVGQVTSAEGGRVEVRPAAGFERLEFVQVLRSLSQILAVEPDRQRLGEAPR